MKRFHLHMRVFDIASNVEFYSSLFAIAPAVHEPHRAQWLLDDPPVIFTISVQDSMPGLEHLGIQVDTREELAWVRQRFAQVDAGTSNALRVAQADVTHEVHLLMDPQGFLWEATQTPQAGGLVPAPSKKA